MSLLRSAITGFVLLSFFNACKEDQQSIHPDITSITESVYSSLIVQPDSLYNVYAAATGIIDSIHVEEGDYVHRGDLLIEIFSERSRLIEENSALNLQLAQNNVNGKSAVVRDLEAQIEIATLKYHNDSSNFSRQQKLQEKGIGSKVEFEAYQLSYVSSKKNLNILEQQYVRSKKELQTLLNQARNNYESNSTLVEDHLVKSKIDGKVYEITGKQGELVTGQVPLAIVGSAKNFTIEMLIDETDIIKVSVGQPVVISLDAYENEVFKAEVTKIYPNKNQRSQTFRIDGIFTEKPTTLYPGLAGEANIIVNEKRNALVIPLEYLTSQNTVFTDDGEIKVEIGYRNLTSVEITSGIDTSTAIYKPAK